MQKRRDRIERWRAERKRKELESAKKEVQKGSIVTNIQVPTSKKWSLEDDSGDEGRIQLESWLFVIHANHSELDESIRGLS